MLKRYFIIIFILFLLGCQKNKAQADNVSYQLPDINKVLAQKKIPVYSYKVIATYPHDATSFTEGLVFNHGYLYESTGLNGKSKLRKIALDTGKVLQEYKLPARYFAEGITILGNQLYQLTYQTHIGFIYNKDNFKIENTFHYPNEGWGLTDDSKQLIMSDGTATLSYLDPNTFHVTRQIIVHDQQQNIGYVNELEYLNGIIYANIWYTNLIAMISPQTGAVVGWINITGLNPSANSLVDSNVPNGIAYNPANKSLLLTGKDWSHVYAIQLRR